VDALLLWIYWRRTAHFAADSDGKWIYIWPKLPHLLNVEDKNYDPCTKAIADGIYRIPYRWVLEVWCLQGEAAMPMTIPANQIWMGHVVLAIPGYSFCLWLVDLWKAVGSAALHPLIPYLIRTAIVDVCGTFLYSVGPWLRDPGKERSPLDWIITSRYWM